MSKEVKLSEIDYQIVETKGRCKAIFSGSKEKIRSVTRTVLEEVGHHPLKIVTKDNVREVTWLHYNQKRVGLKNVLQS